MIVVASGHPGIDRFALGKNPGGVTVASGWAEVEGLWDRADGLFLGQKSAQFDEGVAWLMANADRLGSVRIVLWVGADWAAPPRLQTLPTVSVWRGEIDAQQLVKWWQVRVPSTQHVNLDRRFLVLNAFPYGSSAGMVDAVTEWADQRYGPHGGWIDLDWGGAALSLHWLPEIYQRVDYSFEGLRPRRTRRGHQLIPAPPPWRPGTSGPEPRDLRLLIGQSWDWQGWYLGSQIASPWALELVSSIRSVLVWSGAQPMPAVIERIEQFFREYQDHMQLIVGVDGSGGEMPLNFGDRWPIWTLGSCVESALAAPSRREWWKMPRRKKG